MSSLRGEAEGNIDSGEFKKHTAFPRSQSISIFTRSQSISNQYNWRSQPDFQSCYANISTFKDRKNNELLKK